MHTIFHIFLYISSIKIDIKLRLSLTFFLNFWKYLRILLKKEEPKSINYLPEKKVFSALSFIFEFNLYILCILQIFPYIFGMEVDINWWLHWINESMTFIFFSKFSIIFANFIEKYKKRHNFTLGPWNSINIPLYNKKKFFFLFHVSEIICRCFLYSYSNINLWDTAYNSR